MTPVSRSLLLLFLASYSFAEKFKGFVMTTYSSGTYSSPACDASVANMSSTGVDTVEVVVTQSAATPTDADVVHVIKQILARGMRAVLKPQVDSKDGVWRGEITFNTSTEWSMWFGNYTAFITHYAALAESAGAAYFNVGTELDATEGQAAEWRAVIAAVRGTFSGPLWYGANWSPGVTKVSWWDALDFIGVDAYFPLANASDAAPPVDQLIAAWQPILADLSATAAQWGKQVVLAEVGYASFSGAAAQPWACCSGAPDLELQRSLYTALYAAVWPLPWVAGIFPWAWSAGDYLPGASWVPMGGARFSTDFDVAGKPAQLAIAAAYGGVPEPQPPASARWSTAAAAAGRAAMDAPPAPLALYSDGSLSPGWVDWSFSANVTLRDPTQPFPGHTASLGASVAPEGAVALHTAAGVPVATAGFTALSFDVILAAPAALSSALSAWLCFCDGCNDSAGCQGPSVPVVTYTAGGGSCVLAGAWGQAAAHASVPLAALLPAGPQADWPAVRRVQLGYAYDAGNAALVMTLDNVQFE